MKLVPYLQVSDIAYALNVTSQRIHQMDHLFKPTRDHLGNRRYDAKIANRVIADRIAARSTKAGSL